MILKQLIVSLCFIVLFSACNKVKGPKKPDNLISKDKMVEVLIDAKLIGSAGSVNKMIMKNKGIDVNTYVFAKHNIDSLQFALSNDYYAFYLEDYEEIYNRVEDSLNALKTKFKDLEAKEWKEKTKREEDSIKTLSKEKDTIGLSKVKDSLKILSKIDSLKLLKRNIHKKEGLIEPISDIDFQ